jgi:general secretion pathway protein D
VIADNRTNRMIIKGDSQSRKRIRQLIEMLDVPSAQRLGGLKVFRLKHANAKNLAEILQGLVTGQAVAGTSQSTTSGSNTSIQSLVNNTNNSSNSSSTSGSNINLNSSSGQHQNALTTFSSQGVSIIADATQNALVVKADPQLMREIESAIAQLDIRRQQVLIETAIVEVAGTNIDQLGVQWALGDISSGVGLINFTNTGTSLGSLAAGYLAGGAAQAQALSGLGSGAVFGLGDYQRKSDGSTNFYGVLVQALETNSKTNLLSAPSVVTVDNEEAYIVVGENVPFVTGSVSTSGGTANPYTTIERKDVGITLKVVPQIGEGGTIRLQVEQEASALQSTATKIAADIITSKRAIKTAILAEDGQTIVLGGLMRDNSMEGRHAVPVLGSIPMLGRLFRSDSSENEKRNLLVFIHPTIIKDESDGRNVTRQRYGQLRSLQLEFDSTGGFSSLPDEVNDIYQTRAAAPAIGQDGKQYQTVPVTSTTQAKQSTVIDVRPQTVVNNAKTEPVTPKNERTTSTNAETTIRAE